MTRPDYLPLLRGGIYTTGRNGKHRRHVHTPATVADAMLDLLPDVWGDPELTVLDPAAKTGVFLRQAARRMNYALESVIPDDVDRWQHILDRCHAVAVDDHAAMIVRRTLYGTKHQDGNVTVHTPETIYNPTQLLKGNIMRFDVIIGNPPYQKPNPNPTSNHAPPIYHHFVDAALQLRPRYMTMVTPSRWMSGATATSMLDNLQTGKVSSLVHFPEGADVFPGTAIDGGVSYFLWDRDHDGPCDWVSRRHGHDDVILPGRDLAEHPIVISDVMGVEILDRLAGHDRLPDGLVCARNYVHVDGEGLPSNIEHLDDGGDISVHAAGQYGGRDAIRVSRDRITRGDDMTDVWKVLVPKAHGANTKNGKVFGEPFVAGPGETCSVSYIIIGPFATEKEARSFESYIRTRFCRFVVSLAKPTHNVARGVFRFVPAVPLDREWTDDDLYERFELTADEIAHIESTIKPLPADR